MGLNISKGNMYPWITHTWNTVKGECPHGCIYCYMRRFGKQRPVRFDYSELNTDLGEGNFIFVGSSCDMFAGEVPTEWIMTTLRSCARFDKNRYLFQSKNPSGFGWIYQIVGEERGKLDATLCTTIETNRWYPQIMHQSPRPGDRASAMSYMSNFPRYVTIEPIMDFDLISMVELIKQCEPEQVNIGADSGNNNLPEPSKEKLLALIDALSRFTIIAKKRNFDRILNGRGER